MSSPSQRSDGHCLPNSRTSGCPPSIMSFFRSDVKHYLLHELPYPYPCPAPRKPASTQNRSGATNGLTVAVWPATQSLNQCGGCSGGDSCRVTRFEEHEPLPLRSQLTDGASHHVSGLMPLLCFYAVPCGGSPAVGPAYLLVHNGEEEPEC